jgi:hypothetical protein
MQIIDGYEINIAQQPNFIWEIRVKSPLGHNFFGKISAGNLNEQVAYEIFKENKKQFILELGSEDCQIIKEEVQKPKEEIKNENNTTPEIAVAESGTSGVGNDGVPSEPAQQESNRIETRGNDKASAPSNN